jgi:hypothetical protein
VRRLRKSLPAARPAREKFNERPDLVRDLRP